MAFNGRTDRETYNNFIVSIRDTLNKRGIIDRVEYFGSRFKGTAVGSSDYDNLFVKSDSTITVHPSPYCGYYYLNSHGRSKISRSGRLDMFRMEMQRALRDVGASSFARITNSHGPTVVLYYDRAGVSFSVDTVYGLEVDDQIFVAKPSPQAIGDDYLWYEDKAKEEKNKMKTIDVNNGAGKMAIRRLKRLKEVEPTLNPIKSCVFEYVLMYVKDRHPDELFWRENNLTAILRELCLFMEEALRKGDLPAYFDRCDNVLRGLKTDTRIQLANRFRRLAAHPEIIIDKTD